MKKFFNTIKKVEENLMVALMIAMTTIIFVATVSRFTGLFVISWAEEFARYSMIWLVFLGIGVAATKGEHFCVEVLSMFLPKKALNLVSVIDALLVGAFCVFASYFGAMILENQIASGQITPSLNWPMWIMYLSIPVGLSLMALCYMYQTYEKITGKDQEDQAGEEGAIE